MVSFDRIPDLVGHLVLNEHGGVLESGGDLENDERLAEVVRSIARLTDRIESQDDQQPLGDFSKIEFSFEHHTYLVCMHNRKLYVTKRRLQQQQQQQQQQQMQMQMQHQQQLQQQQTAAPIEEEVLVDFMSNAG
ncbi:hypothetical protein TKK_0003069 [Trichogramma kaykai]